MVLPDPDRSRVVLIGTSRFSDPELPDLPAVRNNLDGLADCLRDIGRCTMVADPESPVALVDPVHDAAAEAEDTLLIYYAGHGLVHPRTLGLLLAVVGSMPGRTHTAVPYDVLRENVLDSPAARKVVILDCCYSGRALGGMADPTTAVANEATVEGTYVLASAPPNKQALSPPGETYTAFTGAMLTLLREGVPNGPSLLRLDLIYRHVRDALKRAARPEPQLRTDNTAAELALIRNPWQARADWEQTKAERHRAGETFRNQTRERLKELIREAGLDNSYSCPVCWKTITGQNLVRHYDKHLPEETTSLDPATLTLTVVSVLIDNHYELGRPITDKVRLATDVLTEQTVVVKRLAAESAVRLDHPAIVRILDIIGTDIVMEHIDGRTLDELLRSAGAMRPHRAAEIIAEVCDALSHAHQNGVMHGNINAGNIMRTGDGTVKVLNFGSGETTDKRSDLYAAGRLLVELLTGSPPVFGVPVPVGIPPALDRVVRTALHPDLAERYQTAATMRDDLIRASRQ